MTILFDSQNLDSKEPFGAVKAGQPINFCVRCECKDADVRIILRNDDSTFEQRVTLLPTESDQDGLTTYRATVTLVSADLYFYRFEIKVLEMLFFCGRNGSRLETGNWLPEWQLTVYNADFTTPDWVKGGVMYQIFPDRFAKSDVFAPLPARGERIRRDDWGGVPQSTLDTRDYSAKDFFGGSLLGITEHLDRLEELGVTLLYLNPIFEGPENHRYGTGDYFSIDPWLGSTLDFITLCKACESRGIQVILDGVFSHTGADSRYFNRLGHYRELGAWQSKASPYYQWYRFDNWPDDYACWWNFPNLPEVDEENPDYTRFVTGEKGVLSHWQAWGCKGWRLDVADELPDGFIDQIRTAIKTADPDALLLGEVWEDATNKISQGHRRRYLLGSQLDSVMNYPFRSAIIDFALSGDSAQFKEKILSVLENYPQPAIDAAMNMLSTHDTMRILNALGVTESILNAQKPGYVFSKESYDIGKRRLKAAAFLQFTLPGIPSIYYGDEAGSTGFEDPFNRGCYPWGQEDQDLLSYFKALSAFRKSQRNDFSDGFTLISENTGLFAYCRRETLCVVHFGKQPGRLALGKNFPLLFSGGEVHLEESALLLAPESFAAFKITN
ncbi:MAG TPA: glycoside hydrolase family 13 protein [Clostridia bacterium]|nr:glycoside hydrolase family 13 protein [Clostridia bacterium]